MSFPLVSLRQIDASGTAPTMSSREIAELVESRHDKVKQSIERLAGRGVIDLPPMGEVSNSGPGPKTIQEYHLGKRDSYVVVAQLSPEFTARLVDRWQELETQVATPPDFLNDPSFLRGTLLTYTEKVIALQAQVTTMAPKAEVFDRLESAEGDLVPSEAAKAIKTSQTECFRLIEELSWAFRRAGRWVGKADAERAGFVRHRTTIYKVGTADHTRLQLVITPRGRNRLAQILNASCLTDQSAAASTADLFGGLQ